MNLGSSSSSLDTKLTDDFWFQIFLFLPFVSIFKLRRVSKVWSSLLSNPHFVSKWIQFNGSDKLPWLVYHNYFLLDIKMRFLISYPKSLSSEFISGNEHGFSFMFLNPNPNPDNGTSIVLLDSSNGLVLCYLKPYGRAMEYYVCNPLTQQWVSLPPAPASISTNEFVIRLTTCKSISSTSCYKVVLIPRSDTKSENFKVGVFSSDVGEWNVYEVSRPKEFTGHFYDFHTLVIVSGVLYWIERGKIIAYNLNNNNNVETGDQQCLSIDFPNLGSEDSYGTCGNNFLGQSEGLLYYAGISTSEKILGIWVFEEDWRLLHKDFDLCDLVADIARKFCLKEAEIARKFREKWYEDWWEEIEEEESAVDYSHEENIAIHELRIFGFNPVDKNVILFSYKYDVWAYNIQTRRHEELASFVPKTLPPGYHFDSVYETFHRVGYPFALKAVPTMVPPPSWESTSSVNVHALNLE